MNLHISVPIANTMEYINGVSISPLISKGVCKVCYVGQNPNRNDTVITKEVATEMGKKLPGSPVVGYFNKEVNDFGGHERDIIVSNGKLEIIDITRPYGFVPTDANVWFQKFNDETGEHEYLVTDVYIWTGAYPEAKRILEKGNNQSMELTEQTGVWANQANSNNRIFIINEALIEKLCVLGEGVEPCFEGAQIKDSFSLSNSSEFQELQTAMYSMLHELQETLSKGGSQESMEDKDTVLTPEKEFEEKKKKPEQEEVKEKEEKTEPEAPEKEEEVKVPEEKEKEEEVKSPEEKDEEEKKPKEKKYNLEEVVEYAELKTQFEELQGNYSQLEQEKATLETEIASLKEFKLGAERQQKLAMIDSFYMLTEADKADVTEHIDTYSLDEIEAKLSIICVRNKVNFNLETPEENKESSNQGLFSLNIPEESDNAPDWIKAIRETAKKH